MKIKQSKLKQLIKESIEATLNNNQEDNTVNFQELINYCNQMKKITEQFNSSFSKFKEFIDGTEEDTQNNIPETYGFMDNLSRKTSPSPNNQDELNYILEDVKFLHDKLYPLQSKLEDFTEALDTVINYTQNYI